MSKNKRDYESILLVSLAALGLGVSFYLGFILGRVTSTHTHGVRVQANADQEVKPAPKPRDRSQEVLA